jgi:antitoxin (DNA-binding transcriptional repressor) of toxin-antitoxin stability system
MRFVSVRDLRAKSAEVWRDLEREREMVIASNGRPVAILAAVDEATLEASLRAFRRGRAVEALGTLQRGAVDRGQGAVGPAEIEAEIGAVRRERPR